MALVFAYTVGALVVATCILGLMMLGHWNAR